MIEEKKWKPNFESSGQTSKPTWTKLILNGVEVCNSIEWVEWEDNPTQVQICEYCGTSQCSSNGYVSIARFGSSVLWIEPNMLDLPENISASCIEKTNVLFLKSDWVRLSSNYKMLPEFANIPNIINWQLLSYVLLRSPLYGITNIRMFEDKITQQIVFVDGIDNDLFLSWFRIFIQNHLNIDLVAENTVKPKDNDFERITVYFDDGFEWNCFLRKDDEIFIEIGEDVYRPPKNVV